MKRSILILAAAMALMALPALADPVEIPPNVFLTTQGEGQYLAKDLLLGAKVQNADGEIIGDVEDLILNADNQVEGVVMGTGGFAGFGEKRVGVELSALQITNEDGKVTVKLPQATKEVLEALEPFKRSKPPKSLLDRAIEKGKELTDKGSVTAKDAYEKAKKEAGPALEKAQKAAEDAYEKAREAVHRATEDTPATEATPEPSTPAEPTTEEPAAQP